MCELGVIIATLRKPNYKSDPTFELLCRALDALEAMRAQRDRLIYDCANEIDYYGTAKTQAAISDPKIASFDSEIVSILKGQQ